MGIMDKIRGLLAGPTQAGGGNAADEQVAEPTPTYGSFEASETAEEVPETEAAPPAPDA